MRGVGVGDGDGEGKGEGVGVWAKVLSGNLVATIPAAPSAGSNLTNDRRLFEVLPGRLFSLASLCFISIFRLTVSPHIQLLILHRHHCARTKTLSAFSSIFDLYNLCFAVSVDCDDEQIVVLALWDYWRIFPAQN